MRVTHSLSSGGEEIDLDWSNDCYRWCCCDDGDFHDDYDDDKMTDLTAVIVGVVVMKVIVMMIMMTMK